ncbi:MAG: hypothetical protein PHU75_03055 [Candidatus Nanopelagicales bacterium]|nr:hypothetical protein [Candidatus Nanopelagicales bacterium]
MGAVVVAIHGFTRGPQHLEILARACNDQGWRCVRPAAAPTWAPVVMHSRAHLVRIADRLAPQLRGHEVVVVGHSAGAAAGAWISAALLDAGVEVRGIVMVDGNDSPNHLIEQSLPQLASVPIRAVLAPPSPCNRQGRLQALLDEQRPGSTTVIPGSGHGDIEMEPSAVYRHACGDDSTLETRHQVLATVVSEIDALLAVSAH